MCWHKWTKWIDRAVNKNGVIITQQKTCVKCNKTKKRFI